MDVGQPSSDTETALCRSKTGPERKKYLHALSKTAARQNR